MKIKNIFIAVLVFETLCICKSYAEDQNNQVTPGGTVLFQTVFGRAGVLTKWSSNETYGTIQARINQEMAHKANADATGITSGYTDSASVFVTPVSALVNLPGGRSFIAFNASSTHSFERESLTYGDFSLGGISIEYMNMPTDNFAWGIGATFDAQNTDLNVSDGTVNSSNGGVRTDVLYKMNDHLAVSSRFAAMWGRTKTMVPIGFTDWKSEQDYTRLYWQTDLVGTLSHEDFSFINERWLVRPSLTTAIHRTERRGTIDNLGAPVEADVINYTMIGASVRIEKPVFRPGAWSPQFEVGVEHEVENTYGHYADENSYLTTKIGFGRRFGKSTYLNVSYSRADGFKGARRQQALTTVYSIAF